MAATDEQDQLDQANLVRSYVPSPGVGTPGSTPVTDQTNLNVAAAMERGDNFDRGFQPQQTVNALRASRDVPDMIGNAIEARRQALAEGLSTGVNPDAPAITVSPKTRTAMLQELHALSGIAHANAIEKAHQTAQMFKQQKDTESSNDYVGFIHDLNGIDSPIGSSEHAAAASKVFEDHPLALQTVAGREAAILHAKVHDTAASLGTFYPTKDAALAENPGATVEQTPRGGWRVTKTGSTYQTAENDLRKNYGLSVADFAQPEDIYAGDRTKDGFVRNENGGLIRIEHTTPKGTKTIATFTKDQFKDLKARLGLSSQQNESTANVAPATTVQPNISQEDYQKLQPGQPFWWNGKQLTKK